MAGVQVYVDASVVLRRLLREAGGLPAIDHAVSSELLSVEISRTLDRLFVERRLTGRELVDALDEGRVYLSAIDQVPLSRAVLARAASHLPTPVGALDAIHLATALLWTEEHGPDLTFLTYNRQLALAARACGLQVAGAR